MAGESRGDAPSTTAGYSIREAARLAGVSAPVVRLWEREGLLRPARTPGGHRVYTEQDVARLRRIVFLRQVDGLNAAAIRRELGAPPAATDEARPQPPEADAAVGRRLHALRKAQRLSLADVAGRTGLSTSFLSAVERGKAGISLGNLFKLADALGTTVPGLLAAPRPLRRRVRPEDRPRFVANRGRVIIEDLITQPGALEAQHIIIAPGGESEEAYAHPGEEFLYLIAGQLTFWIDEHERYVLDAGDSLYFHSTQLHRWRNDGTVPAVILWVNAPLVETGANQPGSRRVVRPRTQEADR